MHPMPSMAAATHQTGPTAPHGHLGSRQVPQWPPHSLSMLQASYGHLSRLLQSIPQSLTAIATTVISLSHPHTPHREEVKVGPLHKFVFTIHSIDRVKMVDSDTLFCLSPLWF